VTKKDTTLVEVGRSPSLHAGAVNTPVYRVSTVLFPDVESLTNNSQPYTYGRRGTPTTRALEDAVCKLEGGARTVLTPSGLSGCLLAIMTACGAGDHLLVTDSVYGTTRISCQRLAKRMGITTTFFSILAAGFLVGVVVGLISVLAAMRVWPPCSTLRVPFAAKMTVNFGPFASAGDFWPSNSTESMLQIPAMAFRSF